MRPVLLAAEERPDGRLALTWSVRPGRRITIVAPPGGLTAEAEEEMILAIIPIIERSTT
jgi:hypothetical protein